MNPIYALLALASAAQAVQYIGHTPSIDQYNAIEAMSQTLFEKTGGASIKTVLRTDAADNDDVAKFLESAGYGANMTLADVRAQINMPQLTTTSTVAARDLLARSAAVTCSSGSKIKLSAEDTDQVCNALSSIAGGTVATLAYVVQGFTCTASDNGHPTFCNAVFVFFGASGTAMSVAEVSKYCPILLAKINDSCDGKGGDATDNDNEVVVQLTQKSISCNDEQGACTQSTFHA